ncbi:hypothetical protein J3Q64DRAFT_1704667 [Phycomyces blakesleeanus]|uniref:SAM domain-containing protein n=1 Tax=Phycomyces blakesleeanus TaxID=4837 RepID=A0ABR3AI21_PHYBL
MEPFGMDEPDTPFDITDPGHRQTQDFLERCNLSNYLPAFIAEGFDTLSSIYEITENDMVDMQIKRGHRRVCNSKGDCFCQGVPRNQPLDINPLRSSDSPVVMCTTLPMAPNNNNSNGGMLRDHRMNSTQNNIGKGLIGSHNGSMGGIGLGVGIGSNNNNGNTNHNINSGNSCGGNNNNGMNNNNNINNGNGAYEATASRPMTTTKPRQTPQATNPSANTDAIQKATSMRQSSHRPHTSCLQQRQGSAQGPEHVHFATIAKFVGDQWKNLSHEENSRMNALLCRQRMNISLRLNVTDKHQNTKIMVLIIITITIIITINILSSKKKQEQEALLYKYQAYLKDFTSKQEANNRQIGRARQRAKQGSTSRYAFTLPEVLSNRLNSCAMEAWWIPALAGIFTEIITLPADRPTETQKAVK